MITFDAVPDKDRLAAALRSSMPPMLVVQEPAAVLALVGAFGLLTRVRGWPLTLLAVGLLAVVGRQVLASRPAGARQAELLDEEAPAEDPDGEG